MKKSVVGALVLLLCIEYVVAVGVAGVLLAAYEVISWAGAIWEMLKNIYSMGKSLLGYDAPNSRVYEDYQYTKISQSLHEISDQIAEFRLYFHERMSSLESLIIYLDERSALREQFSICKQKINAVRMEFAQLVEKLPKPDEKTDLVLLCQYGNTRLNGDVLESKVDAIAEDFVESAWSSEKGLLELLSDSLSLVSDKDCGRGYSPYEYLHFLYNDIIRTEAEGFLALVFSHYFVYHYNGTNTCNYVFASSPQKPVDEAFKKLEMRVQQYSIEFGRVLQHLRNDFRACDGQNLEPDVTYIELEGAIQTYGVPPFWYAGYKICDLARMKEEAHRDEISSGLPYPCLGELHRCETKITPTKFCMDGPYTTRRYKWFSQTDQTVQQIDESECSKQNLYGFYPSGSYYTCLCVCYDNDVWSRSTHVVNLQPVEADFENNMILTGVKFIVEHGVLNLQIQQGKLIDNWRVINTSWKPINDISENIKAARFNKKLFGESPNVIADRDFHVINAKSSLDISTVEVRQDHVATGVKFDLVKRSLQVILLSRPFNHTTGQLKISSRPAYSVAQPSTKERIYERKYPMEKPHDLLPNSTNGEYVKFRESDWWTDSGQTTLPLFDALPLVAMPPHPVGGIGTFLKTAEKSTAMISLKFISLNYRYYMALASHQVESYISHISGNTFSN